MPKTTATKPKRRSPARPANPLLGRWSTPFEIAPFEKIKPEHFRPAFDEALAAHRADIARITGSTAKPTFANTIEAYEKSGKLLRRVGDVFFNLTSTDSTDELQAIEREIAPLLAEHETRILLDPKLFARIDDLHARRDKLRLTDEQRRVLELHHLAFVRAGAKLSKKSKARVAAINLRLAEIVTKFFQNVQKDEQSWRLVLDGERDLAGLPPDFRSAAARAAADAGLPGKHVITLARSSVEGFLKFSERRDLREEAYKAWIKRGEMGGETDNRALIQEIVALRTEYANLLGYATFAEYSLADTMAKTPSAVHDLLGAVWPKAVKRAEAEREALQAEAQAEGGNFAIAAWDWRYYSEKVRKARFDLDEAEIRPYLQLNNVIKAAFDCAGKLFGLKFKERRDVPRYHPDVRVWEVTDRGGAHVGLFLGDYFARSSKRSGAWMSAFRSQQKFGGDVRPIIVNVMNFAQGQPGEPTLLSYDDARTLFHEFGHGLHGLLSDVTYPSISGTSVSRDFVELPSQLYEHWLSQPEVLSKYAIHVKTKKAMPDRLFKRLEAARNFNQGFSTVEYTSSALVDMGLHELAKADGLDVSAFERATLKRLGMPGEISMRHRLPHFLHIVGGYAAGYYSYMWSEVMDTDAFAAFEEAGSIFDKKTAARLKEHIYSAGNRRDPAEAYVAFRGRAPSIDGLLKARGLAD
jgi:peptidyl-dipeptidase Dcp